MDKILKLLKFELKNVEENIDRYETDRVKSVYDYHFKNGRLLELRIRGAFLRDLIKEVENDRQGMEKF